MIQKHLEHICYGYWECELLPNQSIEHFGNGFAKLLGCSPKALSGGSHSWLDRVPSEEKKRYSDRFELIKNAAIGSHHRDKVIFERQDGSQLKVKRKIAVLAHPSCAGAKLLVGSHVRCIENRQSIYDEALSEAIVENIPNMIFVKEAGELRFQLFNRAGEELLGAKRSDLYGKNDYDLFPKEQADFFQQKDRSVLDSKKLHLIEEEPIDTPHGKRWLRTRKVPISDARGRPRYLLGISEDITTIKSQTDEIARQAEALKEAQANAKVGSWEFNIENQEVRWSEEMYKIFEAEGEPSFEQLQALIDSSQYEEWYEKIATCIQTGEPWNLTLKIKRHDGSETWVRDLGRAKFNDQGEVIRLIGTCQDITEQHLLEMQTFHRSKLAAIGELAAGVGHEINNPLTIIAGRVSRLVRVLQSQGVVNQEISDLILSCKHSVKRIESIVQGLRTFARSDVDQITTFELTKAIQQSVDLISEIYTKEGIELFFSSPNDQVLVKGNIGKLQQVFMNLVSNAKDALKGQDKKRIEVLLDQAGSRVILEVRDNGSGIPEKVKGRIFDSFFTTKDLGDGIGLGLGISNTIVAELGGMISFESQEGVGTSFKVELPLSSHNELETGSDEKSFITATKNNLVSKARVLVIDDESEIREVLADYVSVYGWEVVQAGNGKEALDLLRQNDRFDCIFTDLKMPIMDGVEFISNLDRVYTKDYRPTVVAITGGVNTEYSISKSSGLEKKIDFFLTKPFNEEQIAEILNKVALDDEHRKAV